MSTTTTLHLTITGRVQGVGFRIYMQREAMRHGVSGWVRNRSDGGVEAMVQGPTASVEALVEWARHGPPKAQVTDLQAGVGSGDYAEFEVRATE